MFVVIHYTLYNLIFVFTTMEILGIIAVAGAIYGAYKLTPKS